ncbi:MAG: DMT family transporter [Bacteroidales bacterium]
MVYLVLSILSATGIFLVFKLIGQKSLPSFPVIIINYLTACTLGFLINAERIRPNAILEAPWIPISVIIGILFIVFFFVIARSSSEAGISITTVASKMSVVFPIAFSMAIDPNDRLTWLKAVAVFLTLTGVYLTVYKPGNTPSDKKRMLLPLLLFIGMGIVDSLVKFAQHAFVRNENTALFSAVLFFMAFMTGIIILPFRKEGISEFRRWQIWLWGILLGMVNFGSIFMMVNALNYVDKEGIRMDGSIVFGANNIGIVSLSVLAGLLIFKEKLRTINWIGIAISALAIIFFTMA